MNENDVVIHLEGGKSVYHPGDLLQASYRVNSDTDRDVKAVEASVLWYTEGKGTEDFGVHHFERTAGESNHPLDLRQLPRLSTRLPASPLSYGGVVLKIRWCVRLRVFLAWGQEIIVEKAFQLGEVPPAREV
jgi:hypothetical protein